MTVRRAPAVLVLLAACAGGEGSAIDFRILHAPDDDPYAGADTLVVRLDELGRTDPVAELQFPSAARTGEVPVVPDGDAWRFRVDVLARGVVLARGRSLPFAVHGGEPPEERPDVLVGTLGRFVTPVPDAVSTGIEAIAPVDGGALLAASDGTLVRYRVHAHDAIHDGEAALEPIRTVDGRANAAWVALRGGLLLAVGGAAGGASLHDATGETLATLEAGALASQSHAPAVVELPEQCAVLVLGGSADTASLPVDCVTRLDVEADATGAFGLQATRLPSTLAGARRGAAAVAVPVDDPDRECPCARVVVFGGDDGAQPLRTAELVDPRGEEPPVTLEIDASLDGAAATAIDGGLALLAGGRGPDGAPTARVVALDVRPRSLRRVSPEPPAMVVPRSGAAAVRFGNQLILIVAGRGTGGAPLRSAELYDFATDRFGEVASTGALPVPEAAPHAALLGDGTVVVAGAAQTAVYFAPRGDGL